MRCLKERGNVAIIVVGIMAVVILMAGLVLAISSNQSNWFKITEERVDAVYYANDGYNQVVFAMNKDATFYSKAGSGYTMVVDDSTHQVWKNTGGGNYAVQISISKSGGVLSTKEATVTSTGWTSDRPDVKRTVEAVIKMKNMLEYAVILKDMPGNIQYGTAETVFGAVHSNGDFKCDNGARFWGLVTFVKKLYVQQKEVTTLPIHEGDITFRGGAETSKEATWPRDNSSMITWAQMAGGAYYTGRTCIYLDDTNYKVRTYIPANNCYAYNGVAYNFVRPANVYKRVDNGQEYATWSQFKASCPASLPLPSAGIIYVDGSRPTYYGTDPNYDWVISDRTTKFTPALGNVFVAGRLNGKLTIGAAGDIFITSCDPTEWENNSWNARTTDNRYDGLTYTNTSFVADIQGANSVTMPPGYLQPQDTLIEVNSNNGTDILGLVANYCVKINQYNWPRQPETGQNYWTSDNVVGLNNGDNINVYAAIFAIKGTYGVENCNDNGSSQRRRITVGSYAMSAITATFSGGNGYRECNIHDIRMETVSPPYYLSPTTVGWYMDSFREISTPVQ